MQSLDSIMNPIPAQSFSVPSTDQKVKLKLRTLPPTVPVVPSPAEGEEDQDQDAEQDQLEDSAPSSAEDEPGPETAPAHSSFLDLSSFLTMNTSRPPYGGAGRGWRQRRALLDLQKAARDVGEDPPPCMPGLREYTENMLREYQAKKLAGHGQSAAAAAAAAANSARAGVRRTRRPTERLPVVAAPVQMPSNAQRARVEEVEDPNQVWRLDEVSSKGAQGPRPPPNSGAVLCRIPPTQPMPVKEPQKINNLFFSTQLLDARCKNREVRNWAQFGRELLTVSGYRMNAGVWLGAKRSRLEDAGPLPAHLCPPVLPCGQVMGRDESGSGQAGQGNTNSGSVNSAFRKKSKVEKDPLEPKDKRTKEYRAYMAAKAMALAQNYSANGSGVNTPTVAGLESSPAPERYMDVDPDEEDQLAERDSSMAPMEA